MKDERRSDWETPQWLFDHLDVEFCFTRDVCATAENAKCSPFWTLADDALSQKWEGTLWMNPPYGRGVIDQWIAKAHAAACDGATVVCLLPATPGSPWFHKYCRFAEVRFMRGKLKFVGADSVFPYGSAVVIFHGHLYPSEEFKFVDYRQKLLTAQP